MGFILHICVLSADKSLVSIIADFDDVDGDTVEVIGGCNTVGTKVTVAGFDFTTW